MAATKTPMKSEAQQKPNLFTLTRHYLRNNYRNSYLTLGLAIVMSMVISLGIGIFLSAVLYIPISLCPRTVARLITGGSAANNLVSSMPKPNYWVHFLVIFMCSAAPLSWLALNSAIFTRRIYCPGNARLSQIPVWKLMFLCWGLSALLATCSLFFVPPNNENVEKSLLLMAAFFFLIQPLLTNVVLLKVPGMVLEQESLWSGQIFSQMQNPNKMSLVRQLVVFNLLFYVLLASMAVVEVFSSSWAETLPGIEFVVSLLSLLVGFKLSQILAIASIQTYQVLRPESTPFKPTSRSFWPGLAVLAGCGFALYIGLYSYHMAEFARLEKDWQQQLKARQARVHRERAVLRGTPLPGNGAPVYWSLIGKDKQKSYFTMAEADKKGLNDTIQKIASGQPLPSIDIKYLNKYQPHIQLIQKATQHTLLDFAPAFTYDEPLPNYISAQDLGKVMTFIAIDKCQQGQCKDGLLLFLDTWRFGQDVGGQGWLISAMVGVVLEQIAVRNFGPYLQPEDLTPAEYQQALAEIRTLLKTNPSYIYSFLNEAGMMMQMALQLVKQGSGAMDLLGEQTGVFSMAKWGGYLFMLPQILDAYRISSEQLADWQKLDALDYPRLHQRLTDGQELWMQTASDNILTSIAMPNFGGAISRLVIADATLKGFYHYLALMAYFRQQGHYPERLSQLVPQFIPELPKDPFTGNDFHYKRLADDDFRLYSVGEDHKDDGGKGVYFHTGCKTNKDIVFSPSQPKAHCEY